MSCHMVCLGTKGMSVHGGVAVWMGPRHKMLRSIHRMDDGLETFTI
jgi:hypothetical protein